MAESEIAQIGEWVAQVIAALRNRGRPTSVVRLQPHGVMSFAQLIKLIPYYKDLGVEAFYLPPITQARASSTHGYDCVDPQVLDPRFGDEASLQQLSNELLRHGMQLIVDVVANHMALDCANHLWVAELEGSAQRSFFDIAWQEDGKLALPLLVQEPVKAVIGGTLFLVWEQQRLWFQCCGVKVPLALNSYGLVQQYLEERGQSLGVGCKLDHVPHRLILELLQQQPYVLMPWHSGAAKINYRRFFDILDLIGVRQELEQPFRLYHASLCRWIAQGWVQGLRIDHPDGFKLPRQYLCWLQQLIVEACVQQSLPKVSMKAIRDAVAVDLQQSKEALFPIVVEKILTGNEVLPSSWPVDGSVGYEYLNRLTGLFVDHSQEAYFSSLYQEWSHEVIHPHDTLIQCKLNFISSHYIAEMRRLTTLCRCGPADSICPKLLCRALVQATALMPVYRTYFEPLQPPAQHDQELLVTLFQRVGEQDPELLAASQVLLELFATAEQGSEALLLWQQLCPGVMAKGFEDTFLYIYNRFIALNEVGGDPFCFGCSLDEFHRHNQESLACYPYRFISTQTHDAKRSEDVRMRLAALSEMPQQWHHFCQTAKESARECKAIVRNTAVPEANMEYFILQTLAGFWPTLDCVDHLPRLQDYVVKAAREAKRHTNWITPDPRYEQACRDYLQQLLDPQRDPSFLAELHSLVLRTERIGHIKALGAWIVKMVSPGIVDLYQGCDLWFECLVDPDNRRPIDYALRHTLLAELQHHTTFRQQWMYDDPHGVGKMWLIRQGLQQRSHHADLYLKGDYTPLQPSGPAANHIIAFQRSHGGRSAICVVTRHLATTMPDLQQYQPQLWHGSSIELPHPGGYLDLVSGRSFPGSCVPLEDLLAYTPFVWLLSTGHV